MLSIGWRTKHQLLQMYGDENITESIVEAKVAAGHWREHPDLPGDKTMLLYYAGHSLNHPQKMPPSGAASKVLVDLTHCSTEEIRDEMTMRVGSDMDAGSQACFGSYRC